MHLCAGGPVDKLGVFCYSREEGTPAYDFDGQIDDEVKEKRREILETVQTDVVEQRQAQMPGRTLTVLVEGYDRFGECWYGRSVREAPDIDGKIFFTGGSHVQVGDFVQVKIEEVMDYDLIGVAL